MFKSQEPWIEFQVHKALHPDFYVHFSKYHGRLMARFIYGTAAQQFATTDGNTVQAVAKNPSEPLVKVVEIPSDKKMAESLGCMDAKLYTTYAKIVTPTPKSAWEEPNIYDCLFDTTHNYMKKMQKVLNLNCGAFYQPKLYYSDEKRNEAILDQHCLVQRQQLFMGLQTKPLQIKDTNGEFFDHPLFPDQSTYICEVQVDLDHGDLLYVGQEVELKGHMVYVAGNRDKYPPIRKKVRI